MPDTSPTNPAELLSQAAEHALKVLPGKEWEHEVLQLQQAAHLAPRVSNYILDYWMQAFARAVLAQPAPISPVGADTPTPMFVVDFEPGLYGPFPTREAADEWASRNVDREFDASWLVVPVRSPHVETSKPATSASGEVPQ